MTPQLLASAKNWDTATLRRRVEDARLNLKYAHEEWVEDGHKPRNKLAKRVKAARNTYNALAAILRERESEGK